MFENYNYVAQVHDDINSILSGEKVLDDSGTAIPLVADDKFLGAGGREKEGTVRFLVRPDLSQTAIYRKQGNNKWAVVDSVEDTWAEEKDLTPTDESDIIPSMTTDTNTPRKRKIASLIPNADVYLENNFNLLLVGLHGTGKTVTIKNLAQEHGLKLKYFSCSTLDPYTDLVGVPTPRDYCTECKTYYKDTPVCPECGGKTVESLKMVRPRDVDDADIIFFDEFNRADPKTQNALFEIMQFGSINGDPLPNLRCCWAAINPPDDEQNYSVEQLDPALLDRFDLYVDINAKPSVAYLEQHMPVQIAVVLKTWWDAHQEAINKGTKDRHSDYISPRRLEKIGLVWCATQNSRSVHNAFPMGGQFERNKLVNQLKEAQAKVDANTGLTDPDEDYYDEDPDLDYDGNNLGDKPAPQFTYRLGSMRAESAELSEYLRDNPMHHATHERVSQELCKGVGGEQLVTLYGEILNALNPATLEALITGFPAAKVSQMRRGFINLVNSNISEARKMPQLHKVLGQGAQAGNWPTTL